MEQRNDPFAFLGAEEKDLLAPYLTERILHAGEDLYVEGQEDDFMGFVLAGRLAVKKPTEFSGRQHMIALLDPGAVVGESGILQWRRPHGTTVTAIEECRLALLKRESFERLCQEHPDLAISLLGYLLHIVGIRLQQTSHRLSLVV